ncbi:MAG TPA: hypothetical protein VFF40_08825 [Acidimicrobiia bacterium]|nr:hypothetical protein [Acidimicrobiia bacterium]
MSPHDEPTRDTPAGDEPAGDDLPPEEPGGAVFWIGAAVGIAIMGSGIRGVLGQSRGTRPFDLATWVVGADLLADLVIAPLVVLVGVVIVAAVGARWRPPLRAGLMASAIVLAVGWAPLRGYGRATAPDNPTVQPLDYATAITSVLAAIWLMVGVWVVIVAWRHASRRTPNR